MSVGEQLILPKFAPLILSLSEMRRQAGLKGYEKALKSTAGEFHRLGAEARNIQYGCTFAGGEVDAAQFKPGQ